MSDMYMYTCIYMYMYTPSFVMTLTNNTCMYMTDVCKICVHVYMYTVYAFVLEHAVSTCTYVFIYTCVCVLCRYFRTEESKESVLVIPVGSVTAKTEITYEYGVRRGQKHSEKKEEGIHVHVHTLCTCMYMYMVLLCMHIYVYMYMYELLRALHAHACIIWHMMVCTAYTRTLCIQVYMYRG